MKSWIAGALASILTAVAVPLAAQAPAAPAAQCELHAWPAQRLSATTTGWLIGFGVMGQAADTAMHEDQNRSDKSRLTETLDSRRQAEVLGRLDLVSLLKRPPSRVIVHPEPLDAKTLERIHSRRAESASPCYAELIVAEVFYEKQAMYGRSLKAKFFFRDFGAAKSLREPYRGLAGEKLKIFPPENAGLAEAAAKELEDAFAHDVREFATNAQFLGGLGGTAKRR
jgi:hypothetical protein